VRAGRRTKLFNVIGIGQTSQEIRNLRVSEGRYFSPLDLSRAARVAVIGPVAKQRLFGREPALGRVLQIESLSFRVIGVLEAKGDQLVNVNGRDDWAVFVPYTTAQRWFVQGDAVANFSLAPVTREASWDAIRHTRQVLGLHHRFEPELDTALYFFNVQDLLRIVNTVLTGLHVFQVSAGLITLLVGAVGVMNIMLVVVSERRSEIGLRKAVGASGRAIFAQFLAEAGALCALSGLVGSALGSAFCQLVAATLPPNSPVSSPPILDLPLVALLTSSLVLVGVVAGVVPALRASRVEPSEALRAI
jgi:putative ABC transport system permease protein